jgi:hypothetical protein
MPGSLRMVAVLLVGTIFTGLPGAGALAIPAPSAGPPAGCHGRRPATPTGFQCCVNGHHAAIPNAWFTSRPMDARLLVLAGDEQLRLGFAAARLFVMFVIPSNSPPGAAPLRI